MYRVGVDIGGTFTDLLLAGEDRRAVIHKTLTTPGDPSQAVETALSQALGEGMAEARGRGTLVHGTTLVTNAIIERTGAPTALLTTAGFRDALEIGREHRYELYDLNLEFPKPLVPRYLRLDVPERVAADGSVLRPLDEGFVRRLVSELQAKGIRAIAVSYLNSFRNPVHERRTAEIIAEVAPEIRISLSSEVVAEIREFQRTSTTAANVYVQERVSNYLRELSHRFDRIGFQGSFFVMLSSGGIATAETAARFPVRLLESGPAAGALAAAHLGARAGYPDLLSFDMGGTTAKLCAVEDGRPLKTHEFEVDRVYRFRRGSGLPIKIPVIDMIEIGAGGGSMARVDALGLLKVGPQSAGAEPGPACYGRGGDEPTVTDADLVLGYLDPSYFLGGRMRLDVEAARSALSRLAGTLGLTVEEVAWGIYQIVNENMANAARTHMGERGKDPRRLPLYAFGGAGPVHGYRVAEILHLPALISPFGAGVGSTFGLLAAPLAFDFVRSAYSRLDGLQWGSVNGLLDEMARDGRAILEGSGLAGADISYERSADMRFVGQGHEVSVPLPDGVLGEHHLPEVAASFEQVYRALYGRKGPDVPLEVINWRVVATGPHPDSDFRLPQDSADPDRALKGKRPAYFPEFGRYIETPVYDRYALKPGEVFEGPAIVEERESTLVVGARGRAQVDEWLNVIVRFNHE
ncbi:MAG: methylhydantoinase [Deltaproteobacteria bacterium GWA2_57_13]|nr:MAG: methylhydantoinase [Deltaproteobacteria bacterium GWA2_57_13]OGQ82392.1 MAG: methylhydantoinase [Deltaproteobacteria bacterium RIFCSPLOWO2_12_FULL_57_22]